MSICVFGIFVADLCFFANDIPIPGQTILGKKYIIGPGGKGSNQAIAAARAGGNVSFISKVGKDSYADLAISLYERDKINYDGLVISENESTGAAGILINEKTGQNAINVVPGAAGTIDEKLIDSKLNIIESSNVLIKNEEDCKKAGSFFLDKGIKNIIITLGENGCYFKNNKEEFIVPASNLKKPVVDTTGAGDAFNGALSVAISQNKNYKEAIEFANLVAGVSVTREGAANSMPYKEELL